MKFKHIASQPISILLLATLFFSCSELPIITSKGEYRLNSPSSMVMIPSTTLAIVANANVNLDQTTGALMAVDLATNKLLTDTRFDIPNFTGDIFLDTARKRIYVPDHDQALLVYKYKIPGDGGEAISFSEVNVPFPLKNDRHSISNGILTDDGPTEALMIPGTSLGDLILVSNQQGSVSMIQGSNLKPRDMDVDTQYNGLRLFSSYNFQNAQNFPGRGASRMSVSPTTGLVYVTSSSNNQIYVLDPDNQTIEAMIDLDSIAAPTVGMRDIVIDNNQVAYIAHSGLDSVIVLDVSGIIKNAIPYEVIAPPILDIIPVGDGPEDLVLNSTGLTLFVCNQNEDSLYLIDTVTRQITKRTYLDKGKSPGRLILNEPQNTLYSLNFFSNSISLFNETTGALTGEIK